MSKMEILEALITEKLTAAIQETLAVVKTTVSGYEEDILLLKQELFHCKRQLNAALKQPQVRLDRIEFDGVRTSDITPCGSNNESELRHEQNNTENPVCSASETCQEDIGFDHQATTELLEEALLENDESDSSSTDLPGDSSALSPFYRENELQEDSTNDGPTSKMKRRIQRPARYRLNEISNSDCADIKANNDDEWKPRKNKKPLYSNVKRNAQVSLRVGLLKDSPDPQLSDNDFLLEGPVQTILCQQNLSKSDFIKQLRSVFPELGQKQPFDAYLTSSTDTTPPYYTNKMTQEELYEVFRSQKQKQLDLYLQRKEHGISCESLKNTETAEKPSSKYLEEETQDEICAMESILNSAPQSESDEDDDEGRSSASEFAQTIRGRTGGKKSSNISCQVCGYLFRYTSILTKHALSHLNNSKCMCGVCGQQSDSAEELKIHLETHQKFHKCDVCGRLFLGIIAMRLHKAAHGNEMFKCNICRRCFASDEKLKAHQLKHVNEKDPYKCDICSQSFRFKCRFKTHVQNHTSKKSYCCDVCGKSMTNYRNLCHHKLIHAGEKNYSCQICGKAFYTLAFVKQHEKVHTVREKKLLCEICSKTFQTKAELSAHQQTHDSSHAIQCPVCNKLLKGNLGRHMSSHSVEKTFLCSQCGKRFKTQRTLKEHLLTHEDAKSLACSVCGYKCARKDHLATHMRTHTGHKPYKCSLCDKAYTQSHCLKTHMQSHKAGAQPEGEALQ